MIHAAVQTDDQWDTETDWEELARNACTAAIQQTQHGGLVNDPVSIEISVKYASDGEVRKLNAAYRDRDKPTNVLSFPMVQQDMLAGLANSDDGEVLLGDIILAHGVCTREAEAKHINVPQHAVHLIVHGTLHLLGYDHELGDAEAEAMEALETAALVSLGFADPYSPDLNTDEV